MKTPVDWMGDLLERYKIALQMLGRSPATISLATHPHETALAEIKRTTGETLRDG